MKTILITLMQPKITEFIDQGSQYMQQICNHRSCLQW